MFLMYFKTSVFRVFFYILKISRMQRITVAIHPDGTRSFTPEAYQNISWASIIYFPTVSADILEQLQLSSQESVHAILMHTAKL